MNAMRPAGGGSGANVASRRTAGSVFAMPMQFGPTSRMPAARHVRTSASCRARPSSPTSAKPAEMTTSARTPLRPHASAAATTRSAGTTSTARSTGPGTSSTLRYASTLCTTGAFGLTGATAPSKPPRSRLWNTSALIAPRRRDAPMTATARGWKNGVSAWTAACHSRASKRSMASGVKSVASSTRISPGATCVRSGNPASRKTASISWFSGRTTASSVRIPDARACCASCATSSVPSPWPCHASSGGSRPRDCRDA